MEDFSLADGRSIRILKGDLTEQRVDAIVNAANQRMLGGGGVDGAIHRVAGPGLLRACEQLPEVRRGVRCPTGEARITPGFELPASHVIHTVGPVYVSARASAPLLEAAYQASLALARQHGLKSVAFPAISCGVYGYPHADAAPLALRAVVQYGRDIPHVRFVLFGSEDYLAWLQVARAVLGS